MKHYSKPQLELIKLNPADIIATSTIPLGSTPMTDPGDVGARGGWWDDEDW